MLGNTTNSSKQHVVFAFGFVNTPHLSQREIIYREESWKVSHVSTYTQKIVPPICVFFQLWFSKCFVMQECIIVGLWMQKIRDNMKFQRYYSLKFYFVHCIYQ